MTQTREIAFPGQPVADPAQWTGAELAANPRIEQTYLGLAG